MVKILYTTSPKYNANDVISILEGGFKTNGNKHLIGKHTNITKKYIKIKDVNTGEILPKIEWKVSY